MEEKFDFEYFQRAFAELAGEANKFGIQVVVGLLDGDPVNRTETFHCFNRGSHIMALGMAHELVRYLSQAR